MPTINLKELRLNKGLSAEDAAREMGLDNKTTLLNAESGNAKPRPANAFKIASFYGYKVTEVWPLEDVAA